MKDRLMYRVGTAIMILAVVGLVGMLAALAHNVKHHGPVAVIALSCMSAVLCFFAVALARENYR